jgi:hypothetical protein
VPVARGRYEVSREKMRTRHFAYRTEQAYLYWIRRYVNFHNRKHPREMGSREVEAFLTHLAVGEHVSASTQNQALQALLFLRRSDACRRFYPAPRYFGISALPLYCRPLGFSH